MCEHGQAVVVPTPEFAWSIRNMPEKGISIDSCISDVLKKAWEAGVTTLSSCCGHGKSDPAVVLTQDPEQPELASRYLPGFKLYQWLLTEVSGDV